VVEVRRGVQGAHLPRDLARDRVQHGLDLGGLTLGPDIEAARSVLSAAAEEGVDLDAITSEAERKGVQAFCDSYSELLRCIEGKRSPLAEVA